MFSSLANNSKNISVNFLRRKKSRVVFVPLCFVNREMSPGLKRGGYINYIQQYMACYCEDAIPRVLVVDIGNLDVGEKVRTTVVQLPEGVTLAEPDRCDGLVATIAGRRGLE